MSNTPTIKINDQEYKLKITLGFYKRLSFPQSELNSVNDNAIRRFEMLKLALFYGNKQTKVWKTLEDMEKVINDDVLEELADPNLLDKLNEAVYLYLPDSMKKAIKDQEEVNQEAESSKKN